MRARTSGKDASSTSNKPMSPLGSPRQVLSVSSAPAMPRSRFDPERLCVGAHPVARTMSESIRVVVVFPLVPETSTTPCARSLASAAMKSGAIVSATSPGSAVPPRPLIWRPRRVSFPAAFANRARGSGTLRSVRARRVPGPREAGSRARRQRDQVASRATSLLHRWRPHAAHPSSRAAQAR